MGCNSSELSKPELIAYLENEENGLTKSISKGKYLVQVSYRPFDLIWYNEADDLNTNSHYDYFILRISHDNKNPTNELAGSDDYLKANLYLNQLFEDVRLVTESDTLRPIESLASPMYGMTPQASVLLAFDTDLRKQRGTIHFIFKDSQLKTGRSEFEFKANDFKDIPTLIRPTE
ncbi:MAG: hypothetical protein KF775_11960 [Cyclobacteriaceae bacterium]|nr:hypothetical protein [Cyclobacteriaceae bacterium]